MTNTLLVLAAPLINSGNTFANESSHEHKTYSGADESVTEMMQEDENITSESKQPIEDDSQKRGHIHEKR